MAGYSLPTDDPIDRLAIRIDPRPVSWKTRYLRTALYGDLCCGLAAGLLAFAVRFGGSLTDGLGIYIGISFSLPIVWAACVGNRRWLRPEIYWRRFR